jgi:polyhydroxyalkanoate synthesis regulator phasin
MARGDGFRKYVEAGAVLGHVTRARAEEIVRELVNAGEVQRDQAQHWVDDLVERSRKATDGLVDVVRHEVSNQLSSLGIKSVDDLAHQVADILHRSAQAGRSATSGATTRAAKTAQSAKKVATRVTGRKAAKGRKSAPAKKAATKKAPAKTAAAKATKKAPAKKAAAKKSASRLYGMGGLL